VLVWLLKLLYCTINEVGSKFVDLVLHPQVVTSLAHISLYAPIYDIGSFVKLLLFVLQSAQISQFFSADGSEEFIDLNVSLTNCL
jgi:hypothetical protein